MVKPRRQISQAALDLIKGFEGYREVAARLPDGRWTIGHGHTKTARAGARVSRQDAEALLTYDLMAVASVIEAQVFTPLTQNQVDALASFGFNIGIENFRRSAVLRWINAGDMIEAAYAMEIWRKADFEGQRIVVDALVRRRAAEKALFLTPDGGWIPAPSPMVEPKADHGLVVVPSDEETGSPEPFADDAALSPVEVAAANLAARLQALAPDDAPESPPEAPSRAQADISGEPAPFPDGVAHEPAPRPAPPPDSAPAGKPDRETMRRIIFGIPEPRQKLELGAVAPLALLGGAGLAVFIGAVTWAFHAKPTGGAITALNIGVVVVGLIGILCVASAVYFLLERLAGREP